MMTPTFTQHCYVTNVDKFWKHLRGKVKFLKVTSHNYQYTTFSHIQTLVEYVLEKHLVGNHSKNVTPINFRKVFQLSP